MINFKIFEPNDIKKHLYSLFIIFKNSKIFMNYNNSLI
jgi:hypothetical protein